MEDELFEQFLTEWDAKGGKEGHLLDGAQWPGLGKCSIHMALRLFNVWLKENGKLCACP